MLPLGNDVYEQAPYIEITKSDYDSMVSSIKPLDLNDSVHEAEDKFCDGEACVIS